MNESEYRKIIKSIVIENFEEEGFPVFYENDSLQLADPIWREDPVSFPEFVESELFLNHPAFTARQYDDILSFLGTDPKKIFENTKYELCVFLWGKGSGKDLVASCVQAYICYVLLCMRNPQAYFNFPATEAIDIVNVAYSAAEARDVFFAKFRERIKNCAWFYNNFTITEYGILINERKKGKFKLIRILEDKVIFPHLIRAQSKHSQQESYEGLNILFYVMDEASAFRDAGKNANADKVFSTLETSAKSRFTNPKGFILSFPRSKNDFTMRMYELAGTAEGSNIFRSKGTPWEIKPSYFYCGETFDYKGFKIPIELQKAFERRPEESECRYLCLPGEVIDAFLHYPERLDDILCKEDTRLIYTEDAVLEYNVDNFSSTKFVGKEIVGFKPLTLEEKRIPRVIHVDGGLTDCLAALAIGSGRLIKSTYIGTTNEVVTAKQVLIEQILIWRPLRLSDLQVSLNNIDVIIRRLCEVFNIVKVSFDRWESASSLEYLVRHGIKTERHTITFEDYKALRNSIYGQLIILPFEPLSFLHKNDSLIREELSHLKVINGRRIEKELPYSKDASDAVCGVHRLVTSLDLYSVISIDNLKSYPIKGPKILSQNATNTLFENEFNFQKESNKFSMLTRPKPSLVRKVSKK